MGVVDTVFVLLGMSIVYMIVAIFVFVVIGQSAELISSWGKEFKEMDSKKCRWFVSITFLLILSFFIVREYWGETWIGSPLQRGSYRATYYVNAFPGWSEGVKNYRLAAIIAVDNHADSENGESKYSIEKIYFPNGGYEMIDQIEVLDELYKKCQCEDMSGQEWSIEVTDQRVTGHELEALRKKRN